ncbi:MAG: hypothetical protein ACPGOT_02930 [Candidatus Poseidoniaceae archaeon]
MLAPWPTGLLPEASVGTVPTPWGPVTVMEAALDDLLNAEVGAWWGANLTGATVEPSRADRHGRWFLAEHDGATYDLLLCSFGTGRALSSLTQHADRANAMTATGHVQLPVAGCTVDGHEALLVWPHAAQVPLDASLDLCDQFRAAGRVLGTLEPWATPPVERRWNDALATVEQRLGASTLWRAPHDRVTVGLPDLQLSLHSLVEGSEGPRFRPLPRTVDEALTGVLGRRPGLAHAMALEGEAVEAGRAADEGGPEGWFAAWSEGAPSDWSRTRALSTYRGGLWIWRYADVMRWRGRAMVWDDGDLQDATKTWLEDVDRLQARLGVLRMWRSLLWLGAAGVAAAWYAHALDALTEGPSLVLAAASVAVGAGGWLRYRAAEPGPF